MLFFVKSYYLQCSKSLDANLRSTLEILQALLDGHGASAISHTPSSYTPKKQEIRRDFPLH